VSHRLVLICAVLAQSRFYPVRDRGVMKHRIVHYQGLIHTGRGRNETLVPTVCLLDSSTMKPITLCRKLHEYNDLWGYPQMWKSLCVTPNR